MNKPLGRKHELSETLQCVCGMADYDQIWGEDQKIVDDTMELARLLADYDCCSIDELKVRLEQSRSKRKG